MPHKILIKIFSVSLLIGLAVVLYFSTQQVSQKQTSMEMRSRASVPAPQGQITASLDPASGTFYISPAGIGETGSTEIVLDPGGNSLNINTIQLYIEYDYGVYGSSALGFTDADVSRAGIQIENLLPGFSEPPDSNLIINDSASHKMTVSWSTYNFTGGFTLTQPTAVARINWQVIEDNHELQFVFDPGLSKVTLTETGEDVLLTPSAIADYLTTVETAPTTPIVTDSGAVTDNTSLSASWVAVDPETDVVEYQYAIGTSQGISGVNVVNWTTTSQTSITRNGLALNEGVVYYFNVRAKNSLDMWSGVGSSDGIVYEAPLGSLTFKINFQGIRNNDSELSYPQGFSPTVTVRLKQAGQVVATYDNLVVANVNDGTGYYQGTISNIAPGTYEVLVKGWAHMQKRLASSLTFVTGENKVVDWSSESLRAGDVWNTGPADSLDYNMIDMSDLAKTIRPSVFLIVDGSVLATELALYDTNLDSIIDMEDLGKIISNFAPGVYGDQ